MKPYLVFKRMMDFIFALILLIIVLPVMGICGLLIKLEDPDGPVLFIQERIGKDNIPFKMFKLRSMQVKREKDGRKSSDSERMLKIGGVLRKLSLDELPQLINIIQGEMSFIGPRPLPLIYLNYYTEEELHRHDIYPGISGWAQVNGRNFLSWDDTFRLDLEYVDKVSLRFDLKIFVLTIKRILLRSGVGVRGVDFEDRSLHIARKQNNNLNLYQSRSEKK